MLRFNPLEYGQSSTHPTTFAPSKLIRLAMISPISPDPKISTFLPTIYPSIFTYLCAAPAVNTPAGRSPGIAMAPLVLSRHPIFKIMDLPSSFI